MATDGDDITFITGDEKVEPNILQVILEMMIIAQTSHSAGLDKKKEVLEQLEEVLDEDTFNRYKLVFDMSIDLLKFISHDPTMLHGLKNVKTCFLKNICCGKK